jgi:hypothetical protein
MNAKQLELALKKQRLQIQSDHLREQWQAHAQGVAPALGLADQARTGLRWLRRHPSALIGASIAIAAAKPHLLWRWAKRAFFVWQVVRKGRRLG